MEEFHGLYFSAPGDDILHWRYDCPSFPQEKIRSHRLRTRPDKSRLCPVCCKLEEEEKKIGSKEPI